MRSSFCHRRCGQFDEQKGTKQIDNINLRLSFFFPSLSFIHATLALIESELYGEETWQTSRRSTCGFLTGKHKYFLEFMTFDFRYDCEVVFYCTTLNAHSVSVKLIDLSLLCLCTDDK